ncbi:sugar ABC transporter substrate-binding protein [Tianweitania sp.]|uniref:ABC transporter substrate-binding protein n=1 Tax=Tianweitania sp. TaxID=2021634 RepID=UPI002896B720|nr:sugar ABC transporter substrate-binding protein [Tianweitania sp.]
MRKLLRSLVLTTAAYALVASSGATPAFADTVLKFISWQTDDAGTGEWWKAAIAEFEKQHPGVRIEFTKAERSSYADTMTTLFAAGTPPQIVHLASFEFQMFADNGWLEPLDSRIEKDGIDLNGWAGQQKCEWNGETVCIMTNYFGFVMAYNKKILDQAGLAVPTSYQEFFDVAKATTKDLNGDGIVDQFGTGHETKGGPGQYLTEMLNYILDAGAYWTDKDGNITIDTPEMVTGLTRWKELNKSGVGPVDMAASDVRKLFADGKMAMRLDGPWLYGTTEKGSAKADIVYAAPPLNPPLGGSSNVLAIPVDIPEEEKSLVWDFIKLTMSPEYQRLYATLGGNTPPSPTADVSGVEQKLPHFPILLETMKAAAAAGVDRIPTGLELYYNEFSKMIMEESQRMLIEDLDPAEVAKTMQAKAEQLKG